MARSRTRQHGTGQTPRDVSAAPSPDPHEGIPPAAAGDRAEAWAGLLLRAGLIVLAVLWVYAPVYHGDWHWDDDQLLTQNPVVQSKSLAGLWKLWFDPDGADYFPLSYSMLWAQWPFFGMQSTGYHITSILLHAISSLLVWALFRRMRIPGAWLGGLLFAVHPLAVESVAWVSEIKNTASMPFFLLSCLCWVIQDDAAEADPHASPYSLAYWLSVVFFLVAMLAKTSMVALPVVLLIHAWWKRGRITVADLWKTAPCFAISLLLGLVTIHYQHGRAINTEKMPVADIRTLEGLLQRTAVAGMAILFYLGKIVAPLGLLPIYPRWEAPQAWQFLAWPAMFAAVPWMRENLGTAARPGWGRHAAFGLGFFLLMVAPVLGFITISYMRITWVADHFIYLPMLGVIALLAAAAGWWYETEEDGKRPLLLTGAATLFAVLALAAHTYASAWRDEDALWTYTLARNESAWQAHNRLGARKFARNDILAAHHHFTRSTALRPDLGETHNNLGTTLSRLGKMDEAIEQFAIARQLTPTVMQMNVNLYNGLAALGRKEEAEQAARTTLDFFHTDDNPVSSRNDEGGFRKSGMFLMSIGRPGDAIAEFVQAARKRPGDIDVALQLAMAQQAAGRYADAITTLDDVARRLAPAKLPPEQLLVIEQKLADCLVGAGRSADALPRYQRLLAVQPNNGTLWNNMAVTLFNLGRRAEAIEAFQKALSINPNLKDAADGLARAQAAPAAGGPEASASPPAKVPAAPAISIPDSPTLAPAVR